MYSKKCDSAGMTCAMYIVERVVSCFWTLVRYISCRVAIDSKGLSRMRHCAILPRWQILGRFAVLFFLTVTHYVRMWAYRFTCYLYLYFIYVIAYWPGQPVRGPIVISTMDPLTFLLDFLWRSYFHLLRHFRFDLNGHFRFVFRLTGVPVFFRPRQIISGFLLPSKSFPSPRPWLWVVFPVWPFLCHMTLRSLAFDLAKIKLTFG